MPVVVRHWRVLAEVLDQAAHDGEKEEKRGGGRRRIGQSIADAAGSSDVKYETRSPSSQKCLDRLDTRRLETPPS